MITEPKKTELKKYVVWGSYCENVLEKRAPFRQIHLDNLKAMNDAGQLQVIGPTQDLSKVFAVYLAPDMAAARQLFEADIYWQNRIWTDYEIHEWIQVY